MSRHRATPFPLSSSAATSGPAVVIKDITFGDVRDPFVTHSEQTCKASNCFSDGVLHAVWNAPDSRVVRFGTAAARRVGTALPLLPAWPHLAGVQLLLLAVLVLPLSSWSGTRGTIIRSHRSRAGLLSTVIHRPCFVAARRPVVRDSNSGHHLLLPPANCCPIFASRTTRQQSNMELSLKFTFMRNESIAAIAAGKYSNIR